MTVLRFSGYELDELHAELRCPGGEVVRLRAKPFALLSMLVANARRIVTKQEAMQAVWPNVHVSEDSLFQCIREIRTALGDEDRKLIRVVSGRGYVFEADIVRAPPEGADLAATRKPTRAGGKGAGARGSAGRPDRDRQIRWRACFGRAERWRHRPR